MPFEAVIEPLSVRMPVAVAKDNLAEPVAKDAGPPPGTLVSPAPLPTKWLAEAIPLTLRSEPVIPASNVAPAFASPRRFTLLV